MFQENRFQRFGNLPDCLMKFALARVATDDLIDDAFNSLGNRHDIA
jgi:hypothetical protein